MTSELAKTFDPAAIEAKWYRHWEDNGLFRPHRPEATPFTLVNPPPNVTGSLHVGHALDNTLQDVVVRYERLRGKDALWVVGTDHAGIATQMVVERQLEQQQDKRTNYSRDEFVAKVWEWKAESGGTITSQLRRLGCSMDWSREQFTMDPHFTRAVVKVFVDLFNEGLIYRDKRLVNWDPKLKTAISDLEVETQEVKGGFWHFRYPLADGVTLDGGADHIVVATTRPETMLADMAVAVNADDPRYKSVIGKDILQPLTGRRFKVIADEHADPELGSGAVKITPGHDFNDFEVGKRAGIAPGEMLNMFDAEAKVVQTADGLVPAEFLGLDRFDARKLVVERMKQAGFLVPHIDKDGVEHDAEPRVVATPFGDRGGVVIEPWLTDQWYVNAQVLAQPAIEAVRQGAIEIVPKSWEKTFFNWMENIQPWCVSRQLWWGHRIPAWYADKREGDHDSEHDTSRIPFVAKDEAELRSLLDRYYQGEEYVIFDSEEEWLKAGPPLNLRNSVIRDQDVLDTWFSSALWPFATLGWPEENPSPLQGRGRSAEGAEGVGSSLQSDVASGARPHPNPSPEGEGLKSSPSLSLLARHYPNDLLISGFDILFFWDARMAMQGIHFMHDVPWRRLYLHGLVRAADGQKMSKSKGNVVDPLGLIDRYGADALRFFMAAMESQGRDIKMDESRVEGYRNFATKLWNATRFCQANGIGASTSVAAPEATLSANKWIISKLAGALSDVEESLDELRFDRAANRIYHFVWDEFCDWYIELIKGVFALESRETTHPDAQRARTERADETREVAGWVLDQILVMLHPFMPFVTEELWHAQGVRPYELIVAKWPKPEARIDVKATREIDWLIGTVREIRSARTEMNVPPSARPKMEVYLQSEEVKQYLYDNQTSFLRLARVGMISFARDRDHDRAVDSVQTRRAKRGAILIEREGFGANVDLEGIIDIDAEKARLAKALEASQKEAKSLEGRLANPAFVERAKPEAVDKARADHAHHAAEAERLAAALARLG